MTHDYPSPSDTSHSGPTLDLIRDTTAEYFKLDPAALSGPSSPESTHARKVAIYLCRELTEHSIPRIALFFGREAHTVDQAHQSLRKALGQDNFDLQDEVSAIASKILNRMEGK